MNCKVAPKLWDTIAALLGKTAGNIIPSFLIEFRNRNCRFEKAESLSVLRDVRMFDVLSTLSAIKAVQRGVRI
jgi:hypothetical protein